MCLCLCCPSASFCTLLASILTAIEACSFAALNLASILACTCSIEPPTRSSLRTEFMEQVWSWFLYDKSECQEKYVNYSAPGWIVDVPSYLQKADIYNAVDQHANYSYQVTYFIIHALWFFAAIFLCYGNARQRPVHYIPWLIMTTIATILDTVVGSFYIRFMDDTNPGWDDGRAIFAMQFLYFRGFIIYIYNIMALGFAATAFWGAYRKARKQDKLVDALRPKVVVQPAVIVTSPINTAVPGHSTYQGQPYQHASGSGYNMDPAQVSPQNQPTVPTKYRPFSYVNPGYRPVNPHDVKGMKSNAPEAPFLAGYENAAVELENIDAKIPRASIKKY